MYTKKIRNLFQCITVGDVRFDYPLIALLSVSNRCVRKESVQRRSPGITLGPRDLYYFSLVAQQFLHARHETLTSQKNLTNKFFPRPPMIRQTVGHKFPIPLPGGDGFLGKLPQHSVDC